MKYNEGRLSGGAARGHAQYVVTRSLVAVLRVTTYCGQATLLYNASARSEFTAWCNLRNVDELYIGGEVPGVALGRIRHSVLLCTHFTPTAWPGHGWCHH
jgi:hypothetical protein